MSFNLPKSLLPSPSFLGEVGIIVLGVLIALGIGEIADGIRWHYVVADTMSSIRTELASDAGVFDERAIAQPCLERRLRDVDALLREARKTGRLARIENVSWPGFRPMEHSVWDTTLGGETMRHLDPGQRQRLSLLYTSIAAYEAMGPEEMEGWYTLSLMENAPGPISDDLVAELATTTSRLRFRTGFEGTISQQMSETIASFGIKPNYVLLEPGTTHASIVAQVTKSPLCEPMLVDGKPLSESPASR